MSSGKQAPIYLDNAATTAVDPEIADEMRRIMVEGYGNPSSRHPMGLDAQRLLREAAQRIARPFGVAPKQLVFTGSASEALALAVHSVGARQRKPGHVLYSSLEHPAVKQAIVQLGKAGHTVEQLDVDETGRIDPELLAEAIHPDTFLLAVMLVNNELGVTQPVGRLSRSAKRVSPSCKVLCDMVQAYGLLDTAIEELGVDLAAVSAHKLHGPKGVGCLARRQGVQLTPMWVAGGQQGGMRGGTEDVPGIVGLGMAAERGKGAIADLRELSATLCRGVQRAVPGARLLGDPSLLCPHIRAFVIPNAASEVLVNALAHRGIFISSGSACHSRKSLRSPALASFGVRPQDAVLRFSLSKLTVESELHTASTILGEVVSELRKQ